MSKESQRGWTAVVPWLAGATLFAVGLRSIAGPAFWSHLATGRQIALAGLPRTDVFTFTHADAPWINATWLYDRALFALWRIGGAPLIVLLHAALLVAAAALLMRAARAWAGPAAIAGAALLAAGLLLPHPPAGPQAPALLLAALFARQLADRPPDRRLAALLVPLQLLWTQMHPTFLLGPAIALLAWLGRRAPRTPALRRPGFEAPGSMRGLALAGGLAVVTLVNPYGIALHRLAWHSLTRPDAAADALASPLAPLYLSLPHAPLFLLALLLGAAGLVAHKGRLPAIPAGLAMGTAIAALRTPYLRPFFAVLSLPFLALSLQAAGGSAGELLRARLRLPLPAVRGLGPAAAAVLALLSIGGLAGGAYDRAAGTLARPGLHAETEPFPAAAAAFVGREGFPERALNLPFDGGYLRWAHPERRIFADVRRGLNEPELHRTLNRALAGEAAALDELEDDWSFDAAILSCLWPGGADLARWMVNSGRWQIGYVDGVTVVLVRPGAADAAADASADGLARLEAAIREAEAAVRQGRRPRLTPRLAGAGFFFSAMGRHREAAHVLGLVEQAAPRMISAPLQRAHSLGRIGRHAEAARRLEAVVARRPRHREAWAMLAEARAALGEEEAAAQARARAEALGRRRRRGS